ncbi:MAG: NYN domain-containing protein, partial [Acidobacteriota bacterium]
MSDERLKIAVFIDFDNVEIGVKNTLGLNFDIGAVLEAIKERGEVITKVAFGDWKRSGDYGRAMSNHAVRLVQRVMTPGGDKNGADINLALDALEMAFTHDHINAFVIVGGDSDFITLVEKLKQYDKKVFVVGGRQFTSQVMQKNCTEFIAYENVVGRGGSSSGSSHRSSGDRSRPAAAGVPVGVGQAMNIDAIVPLVRRALKVLADREVTPQLGLLKSTLLQLDSSFSERDYGVSSFRDFAEKLAEKGI